ncbi:serine/threonine-protein kinase [Roseateles saccharophilus]|uniref:Serine/threonine-protein kinase n=1 Tax=Roseateles saccharophilus TaxID=304 RepID=A0A4R3VIV5_ROSSA|nr:serine/threonine-protein kinase [Roseateles saccharophilus]MDG0831180.1 serine/threonine protein kinase [Roseateles saccharophilus]TCV04301.1 serine/threonine-protein kinase [Roseateles saccharophilus]
MQTGPGLQASDWKRLSALFDELAELPAAERQARLAALQPPELAARLARMLASLPAEDEDATVIVEMPGYNAGLVAALSEPTLSATTPPQPGDRLGSWCLAELLGEGGMGQVWRAERADGLYQGEAAIKLLRADRSGPGLAARFARERALLGRLTHPGIARMLDAGEQDGRAYLVLEYVPGRTLSEHVREHDLGLVERVRLLLEVARAVEHAHAQLILHRDLKPGNVMVDERGKAKLLDFGIAGLLDDSGHQADHQLTLISGRRLTPAYAAPEQITGESVGVASDIYSLGVMLYELASGELPFGERGLNRTALEHAVLHGDAQRISRSTRGTRTSGSTGGATLHGASASAGPGRPHDAERAAGDLEAIAAKALRKEPAERYASVGGFIDDLEHWLAQRPVSVRAEDWWHRVRLWMRRNAALAIGATLMFATLSAGLAVSLWQRREAQAAARQSEAVTRFLTELLSSANPDRHGGHTPNVLELLDRSRAELPTRFADDPVTHARVLEVMGNTYADMNRFDVALPLADQLVALTRELWGEDDPASLRALRLRLRLDTALSSPLGVIARGEPLLAALEHRHVDPGEQLDLRYQLIVAYAQAGRPDDAERLRAETWPLVLERFPADSFDAQYFNAYVYHLRLAQGRLQDAEKLMLDIRPAMLKPPAHRERFALQLRRHLWNAQARLGRPEATVEAALQLAADCDALLGPGNLSAQRTRSDLARQLGARGQWAEALPVHETLAASIRAADHPRLRLPLDAAALLARVNAGRSQGAAAEVQRLTEALQPSQLLTGPNWVEASGNVVRAALALQRPDLAGIALAPLQDLEAQPWLQQHAALQSLIAQWQGELLRARGALPASIAALRQRVAYLDGLPQPEPLAHWAAQLDLALSLRRARQPVAEALARADALRPAWLGSHPLDRLRRELDGPAMPADWDGQF